MNFLFGLVSKNVTEAKPRDTGFRGISLGLVSKGRTLRIQKGPTLGICSILSILLLSFFLFPHTTYANGLIKAPSNLSLVGYWPMNEGDGSTVFDLSGNGNHGSYQGTPTRVRGKLGGGINFSVYLNYVQIPDSTSLDTTSAVTLSAWIKLNANSDTQPIIFKDGNYELSVTGGVLRMSWWSGSSIRAVDATAPSAGQWHHVIGVATANDAAAVYIDGVSAGGAPYTLSGGVGQNLANPIVFGTGTGGGYNGSIDEARVYTRTLSASEISGLYGASVVVRKTVSNQGLKGYWPLDEGSGTTIYDVSGNQNNGSVFASTGWGKGRRGEALKFSSNSDWASSSIKNTFNISTSPQTVNMWYKQSASLSNVAMLTIRNNAGSGGYHMGGGLGDVQVALWGGGNVMNAASSTTPFGQWGMLTFTYDGTGSTGYRMYDNGKLLSSTRINDLASVNADQVVFSGYDTGSGGRFGGNDQLDEVRVYNRVLSADEVGALYSAGQQNLAKTQTDIVTNGLIAYWPFDGRYVNWATGKALDASGNSRDVSFIGLATTSSVTTGKIGQALKFDGVSTYLTGGSNGIYDMGTSDWTTSAWVKVSNAPTFPVVIGKASFTGGGSPDAWLMNVSSTGKLNALMFKSGRSTFTTVNDGASVNDGQWHHITAVWNRTGNLLRYVDGVLTGTALDISSESAQNLSSSREMQIAGRDQSADRLLFAGGIDEVRVYNRALSAAEIKLLYNVGR